MARNTRYSKEYKNWLTLNAPKYTMKELINISKEKFDYEEINAKKIRNILLKITDAKWKDYCVSKTIGNEVFSKPIGTESTRCDGMTKIKVGNKKWIYKQRYIYEQHYGKLPDNYMVVFLDGDRTNYDIDNLMAVETKEYNYARNKNILSKNGEVTKTALLSARLNYKIKEKQNENN